MTGMHLLTHWQQRYLKLWCSNSTSTYSETRFLIKSKDRCLMMVICSACFNTTWCPILRTQSTWWSHAATMKVRELVLVEKWWCTLLLTLLIFLNSILVMIYLNGNGAKFIEWDILMSLSERYQFSKIYILTMFQLEATKIQSFSLIISTLLQTWSQELKIIGFLAPTPQTWESWLI